MYLQKINGTEPSRMKHINTQNNTALYTHRGNQLMHI